MPTSRNPLSSAHPGLSNSAAYPYKSGSRELRDINGGLMGNSNLVSDLIPPSESKNSPLGNKLEQQEAGYSNNVELTSSNPSVFNNGVRNEDQDKSSSPSRARRSSVRRRRSSMVVYKDEPFQYEYQHSSGSSGNSSRRPSLVPAYNSVSSLKVFSSRQSSPARTPGRSNTLTPVLGPKQISQNQDIATPIPTLVLPPELASLKTQSTSNFSLSHQSPEHAPAQSATAKSSSTTVQNTQQMASSSRISLNNLGSSTTPVSKVQQNSWNEKQYIEKIQNYASHDYYTRGIVASTTKEEDAELELEMDDMIGNSINNDDDVDFGTNFFTEYNNPSNSILMSSKYLLHRLEWLKHSDPSNMTVRDVFKNINGKSEFGKDELASNFSSLPIDSQKLLSQLSEHPLVIERFEWQTMLSNVLRGDIIKSEKSKIASQVKPAGLNRQINQDIWLELKSWMNGKSVEDQKKVLENLRNSTDSFFEEILHFKLDDDLTFEEAESIITPLINKHFKIINYWCNLKQLYEDKPITKTPEYSNKIDALISWLNFYTNFESQINSLREWVGNRDLDVTKVMMSSSNIEGVYHNGRSFAEQIMNEKGIETIFQKKIFFPLAPWMLKAKLFFFDYRDIIDSLNLSYPYQQIELLLMFPMKLVKEVILVRLEYAKQIENPTLMMIDEMIDDITSYIRLSVQLKYTINEYCIDWNFEVEIDPTFNDTVIKAISYLFTLLNLKLLDSQKMSFKTFKEPDELFKYWDELKNVGHYIDGAGKLIAREFNRLSLRLLNRLHLYTLQEHIQHPTCPTSIEAEKWLLQLFENVGTTKRKLNRFTNILAKSVQNSINFKIEDHDLLLEHLKNAGYFLIYTGGELEQNGYYLIGSPELLGCKDTEILKILQNSDIGCDLIPKLEIKNSLALYNASDRAFNPYSIITHDFGDDGTSYYNILNENEKLNTRRNPRNISGIFHDPDKELFSLEKQLQSLGCILVLSPSEPMLWEGEMYNLSDDFILKLDEFKIKVSPNHLTMLNQGSSHSLTYLSDKMLQLAGNCISFVERKCSFSSVENGLQRINKAYFRITYSVLNNFPKVLSTYHKICPGDELLNSIFLFARDFGRSFLRVNVATYAKKSVIIMLLMKISITWLSFLVEKCDPTDLRTFRWCVPAIEFAMQITSGWNILGLDDKQFTMLKQKIASSMSLLISHFDVMGARALEAERTPQQIRPHIDIEDDVGDDDMLMINSQVRMRAIEELENQTIRNPHRVGKVLDDTDKDNKYLLSLASSMSNVSIKWQKRQFIGSGTFGNVFSAVNLGSGEILAVKEIKIQDSKTMEKIFPLIKEEMSVLEMLNHPNIVQYYGIEVHRDKVNIFMEFCEGGSLASLLEHGRIEDEMVTQMYSLQLLEGLAYLHQSGIVHRDIKPENILLDFNGIIKYVDFGAARKLVESNSKFITTSNKSDAEDDQDTTKMSSIKNDGNGVMNMVGTPMYMAPEAITGSPSKGKFGADDVWSLGCVVLEMVTGKRPWANLDNEWAIMYHVAAGHIPPLPANDELSTIGFKFLRRSLQQNPSTRATAVELLTDPWIVEIRELAFGTPDSETSANTSLGEAEQQQN
ncbi:hypothetical protein Kpol_1028p40 [Vanderwaltozyma polyspora DSM 70294]|uniref:Protein kinase domain-containing protein n=1 Tax=Vanderwaltozyma polyspora (strain ATCC 22028 / DSM 70294 / BCRC 21397 / CBS 2163 / NBRC 10782 / NRRL Y-8283 / UCD 57-17) TaxID=436907 RepID=A7TG09_VANPO|nr:uncharacterized protein Kpol_1028p40 [Vanderwaltozyma polyspora DSM 70294]EDO18766.1 hypothetical protein Kpol_1028p40 [Vanderwaltozyma polyspora DSM 70294]